MIAELNITSYFGRLNVECFIPQCSARCHPECCWKGFLSQSITSPPFESSKVLVTISRFNILNYAIYSFARRSLPCFLMHHYSSIRFQNIEQHCHCKESFFPNSLGNCLLLQEKQMKQMKKDKLPSDKNTPNICGILQSK